MGVNGIVNPHILQQKIHSTFSTGQAVWSSFKDEILAELLNVGEIRVARDHLLREFNRKVINLGFNDLSFSPYDGGYRFIGATLEAGADAGYVFLYANNGDQVFTDEDLAVQVPDSFANS